MVHKRPCKHTKARYISETLPGTCWFKLLAFSTFSLFSLGWWAKMLKGKAPESSQNPLSLRLNHTLPPPRDIQDARAARRSPALLALRCLTSAGIHGWSKHVETALLLMDALVRMIHRHQFGSISDHFGSSAEFKHEIDLPAGKRS